MTQEQLRVLVDLGGRGWVSLAPQYRYPDQMVCGGPAYVLDKRSQLHMVESDGRVIRMHAGEEVDYKG